MHLPFYISTEYPNGKFIFDVDSVRILLYRAADPNPDNWSDPDPDIWSDPDPDSWSDPDLGLVFVEAYFRI